MNIDNLTQIKRLESLQKVTNRLPRNAHEIMSTTIFSVATAQKTGKMTSQIHILLNPRP